jgi:UDP-N-acetylmuramoylalanine--D-glutamate ligase
MTLDELSRKSVLILGFGTEGQATYDFRRKKWPEKPLSIADKRPMDEFSNDVIARIQDDAALNLNFGPRYLDSADGYNCDVIIKTPGIPASLQAIARARKAGRVLISHSQIFLDNYPRRKVIGVTGTKGKSTTASLIHHILKSSGVASVLVGNIGQPPLPLINTVSEGTYFVHEFSSHQLAEVETSPHIAVLLNIVPEHLDYYANFEEYVAAKENITKFQTRDDFLIFAADYPIPNAIAGRSKATLKPFTIDRIDEILDVSEICAARQIQPSECHGCHTAASCCGVEANAIQNAVRTFEPLPHRLEPVGAYKASVLR